VAELDELIPFDRSGYGRMHRSVGMFTSFWQFVRELRGRRFDLVIDLQGLFRSGFIALGTGAGRRIGFADGREFAPLFYTRRVVCPRGPVHAVDRNLRVAAALGLPVDRPRFPLGLRPTELEEARALVAATAGQPLPRFLAVVPGARWVTKLWRPERIAAVLDRLHDAGAPPAVLLGAPDEREIAGRVSAAARAPLVDLVGRTSLRQLTAVLNLAEAVLCHDSGPMHIAAALHRPTVALFGPTDPRRCGPYSPVARVVQTAIDCSPCYRRTCDHHSCMERLTVDTVYNAIAPLVCPPTATPAGALAAGRAR
jgi:heptosyltransferase-1